MRVLEHRASKLFPENFMAGVGETTNSDLQQNQEQHQR